MSEKGKRFNEILIQSIDTTMVELLGSRVSSDLHKHLKGHYGVTSEELPYRLETMYALLKDVFGITGERTIERQIARRFAREFNIPFLDTIDCTLPMYIDKAKAIS